MKQSITTEGKSANLHQQAGEEAFCATEDVICFSSENDAVPRAQSDTSGGVALTPSASALEYSVEPKEVCVTLVEYGDYECPACRQAHHVVASVRQALGVNLRFEFRHFPLRDIHQHAQRAAEAAECAGAQGRFWEMHHLLFTHQNALNNGAIVEYADKLGLDIPQFLRDMKGHLYAGRVQEDITSGELSGVTGTPTFFINGTRYVGAGDYAELVAALQDALSRE